MAACYFADLCCHPAPADCGARQCVEAFRSFGPYAVCAIGGRNLRCDSEIDQTFCDDNVINVCHGEFVEVATDCAAKGLFCATKPTSRGENRGACVTSKLPSPRCPDDAPPGLFCDGDRRAQCFGNLVIAATEPCSAIGKRCVEHPPSARCE